jgi:hypothetical protein
VETGIGGKRKGLLLVEMGIALLLIIVDYYTPRDYESWLLLLFCLSY